jgi:hypothetical protein
MFLAAIENHPMPVNPLNRTGYGVFDHDVALERLTIDVAHSELSRDPAWTICIGMILMSAELSLLIALLGGSRPRGSERFVGATRPAFKI